MTARILQFFILVSAILPAIVRPGSATWSAGWTDWEPYQMEIRQDNVQGVSGLDVVILREILRRMDLRSEWARMDWSDQLDAIRDGRLHVISGAFHTREREAYAHVSHPYRFEETVLIHRRGERRQLDFSTKNDLRVLLADGRLRLGRISGYAYADPALTDLLSEPALQESQIFYRNEREALYALLSGEVDLVPADRLIFQTLAWREGQQTRIAEHPALRVSASIHFLLSRKLTDEADLERFNAVLESMRKEGSLGQVQREYLHPLLLSITVSSRWFFALEIIGVIAFSISGFLLARRERYSFNAGVLFSILPALGGGIVRDLLLQRVPIAMIRTPAYLLTVLITVSLGHFLLRVLKGGTERGGKLAERIILIADALGLASFTVAAVVVAVEMRVEPLWLWGPLMSVITATGGGIVRDTIRSDGRMAVLTTDFYAEVALIWGVLISLALGWQADQLDLNRVVWIVGISTVGGFLTRMAAIHWKWKPPQS